MPLLLAFGLLLHACSCANTRIATPDSGLEKAIESYIAGDYETAVSRLEKLAKGNLSEDDLAGVYLYLGRSYLALGDYNNAAGAFSTGKALGGGTVFDEYLGRLDVLVAGAEDVVFSQVRVTRKQLASLVDAMFYRKPSAQDGPVPLDGQRGRVETLAPVRRGIVPVLPDGDFHADAFVTTAAFFVAVSGILADNGLEGTADTFFAGGFERFVENENKTPGVTKFITGKEVVTTLRRVASAIESNGKQGS